MVREELMSRSPEAEVFIDGSSSPSSIHNIAIAPGR
jgi:hypothetical protein